MKNFILVTTALFTILCTHQTTLCTAQDNIARFGIKGGLNYSNLDVRDATNSSWLIGFNLGIFTKLPFTNFIAL